MTIRPCPTCGGDGLLCVGPPHDHDDGCRCPSCADMPWLPCPRLTPNGKHLSYSPVRPEDEGVACPICGGTNGFKPDPETVTLWCFTHRCVVQDGSNKCDSWRVTMDDSLPCDIGWTTRPERLEVAE